MYDEIKITSDHQSLLNGSNNVPAAIKKPIGEKWKKD
jgi:hypothetical protein